MSNNKIENKIFQRIVEYLVYLLRLNFNTFPYVCVVIFTLMILESLTYPGFVNNHLYVNIEFIIIAMVFSGLLAGLTHATENNKNYPTLNVKVYEFLNYLLSISIFPMLIMLYLLESFVSPGRDSIIFNQKNLIFPGRVFIAFAIVIFYLFIYNIFISKSHGKAKVKLLNYFRNGNFAKVMPTFIYYTIVIFMIVYSVKIAAPDVKHDLRMILRNPFYTYEQKMAVLVGPNYSYYMFVKANTPDDAVILKPKQQGRWPDLSNEGYSRYFLYPRKYISEENLSTDNSTRVTHAFLVGNVKLINTEVLDRWPNFNVPADKIVLYSPETRGVYKTIETDYNFNDFEYPQYWGLIVVDNNKKW